MLDRSLLRTDMFTRSRYSQGAGIYRMIPDAVAHCVTPEDLHLVFAAATEHGWTITPRGAGSAMDGSNVTGTGMVLDLSDFGGRRCHIDPAQRLATVAPSTPLAALNAAAGTHGLRMPVDPSSNAWATLGGMVSTNASGPHTVAVGSVREWVRSITIDNGEGPLQLKRGAAPDSAHPLVQRWRQGLQPLLDRNASEIVARYPRVRKNSAGYALSAYIASGNLLDLVIGSEGTLGVITEVTLALAPMPAFRVSLRVVLASRLDLARHIELLRQWRPATLELLDSSFLGVVAPRASTGDAALWRQAGAVLLLDFEGAEHHEVMQRAEAAAAAVRDSAIDVLIATDLDAIAQLWQVRHGASPALSALTDGRRSLQVVEDACVPMEALAEYLDTVERVSHQHAINAVMFGHAGDGHVHVNLLPNLRDPEWKERVRAIYVAVSAAVLRLGGTPTGEHGAGRLRAGLLPPLYGPAVIDCFHAVKDTFDPAHRFNLGVILGDGSDPLGHLKLGDDAKTLPAGVAEWLHNVEADARWAEARWGEAE